MSSHPRWRASAAALGLLILSCEGADLRNAASTQPLSTLGGVGPATTVGSSGPGATAVSSEAPSAERTPPPEAVCPAAGTSETVVVAEFTDKQLREYAAWPRESPHGISPELPSPHRWHAVNLSEDWDHVDVDSGDVLDFPWRSAGVIWSVRPRGDGWLLLSNAPLSRATPSFIQTTLECNRDGQRYWYEFDADKPEARILRTSPGGAEVVFHTSLPRNRSAGLYRPGFTEMVCDASGIYLLDQAQYQVLRLDHAGRATVLARDQFQPSQLVLGDAEAFWFVGGGETRMGPGAALRAVTKEGGAVRTVVRWEAMPYYLWRAGRRSMVVLAPKVPRQLPKPVLNLGAVAPIVGVLQVLHVADARSENLIELSNPSGQFTIDSDCAYLTRQTHKATVQLLAQGLGSAP